jgi:hypothetical protein
MTQEEAPMQDQTKQTRDTHDRQIERAIVLQLLSDDHDGRCSRAALRGAFEHVEYHTIDDSLTRLQEHGVIELAGESIRASHATRHLDELEVLAI